MWLWSVVVAFVCVYDGGGCISEVVMVKCIGGSQFKRRGDNKETQTIRDMYIHCCGNAHLNDDSMSQRRNLNALHVILNCVDVHGGQSARGDKSHMHTYVVGRVCMPINQGSQTQCLHRYCMAYIA